jgi:hypothetical protein
MFEPQRLQTNTRLVALDRRRLVRVEGVPAVGSTHLAGRDGASLICAACCSH